MIEEILLKFSATYYPNTHEGVTLSESYALWPGELENRASHRPLCIVPPPYESEIKQVTPDERETEV